MRQRMLAAHSSTFAFASISLIENRRSATHYAADFSIKRGGKAVCVISIRVMSVSATLSFAAARGASKAALAHQILGALCASSLANIPIESSENPRDRIASH